jgi:hypothetical protein
MFILGASEHVHMDTHAAQLAGEVADIYIHPAGILASQDGKRAGMVGEHGNAQHNQPEYIWVFSLCLTRQGGKCSSFRQALGTTQGTNLA